MKKETKIWDEGRNLFKIIKIKLHNKKKSIPPKEYLLNLW